MSKHTNWIDDNVIHTPGLQLTGIETISSAIAKIISNYTVNSPSKQALPQNLLYMQ